MPCGRVSRLAAGRAGDGGGSWAGDAGVREMEGGIRRMKWGGEFGATEWLFWAELGI